MAGKITTSPAGLLIVINSYVPKDTVWCVPTRENPRCIYTDSQQTLEEFFRQRGVVYNIKPEAWEDEDMATTLCRIGSFMADKPT